MATPNPSEEAAGLRLDVELRSAVEHAVAAGLAKQPTAQNDSRLI
jgi:hypothetical protein